MNFDRYLNLFNRNPLFRTTLIKRMNNLKGPLEDAERWTPCDDLIEDQKRCNYGLLILNTPINICCNPGIILNLWEQAKVRITVDGGTKRWADWLTKNNYELEKVKQPELITGDMDSLSCETLKRFPNSKVIKTPDQNETDYTKALKELKAFCNRQHIQIEKVYVLVDTWGRFDQIMANVNTLYKKHNILGDIKIFQVASTSLTWLLEKGSHVIEIARVLSKNQDWCALIPIGSPCTITTTGLKWNLDSHCLQFGGLVSSSNTYDGSPVVTVKTDNPIVWSMSIESLL